VARSRRTAGAVRKLPSGRWQTRLRDPLTYRMVSIGTFATARRASDALAEAQTDQHRGAWVAPERSRTTVGEWAERWFASTGHLRPNTQALYRWLLDRYVLPTFGAAELGAVDTQAVRRWLSNLHKSGLSKSTIAKAYRVLRQLLQHAVDAGYISRNPCSIRGAASEPEPAMRCPTIDDVLAVADAIDPRFRALVLLAGLGGLRWGECAGLRRCRVDLLHRTVSITEQATEIMGGRLDIGPPKTTAGIRTVAVPGLAVETLAVHLDTYAEAAEDGLVFPAPTGGYLRRSNFMNRYWGPATRAAGCNELRFHDLRHGAATLAAATGATTKELMARLGHASPVAALRYQHVVSGRDAAIADAIDAVARATEVPARARVVPVERVGNGTLVARRTSRR
jgi:integrase